MLPTMEKLKGKTALITGSDSGIGRAIALEFAKQGAHVVITYHSDKEGAEEAERAAEEAGENALVINLDVSNEKSVEKAFQATLDKFGQLDILVNNAGVNGSNIPIDQMSTEVFDTTIKTNLYGTFFCCRNL